MTTLIDGNAIVYCEGAFGSTYGKTAHGLVRRTSRYRVIAVVDSTLAGQDAGVALDGTPRNIPIARDIPEAIVIGRDRGEPATHLVVGLAPDGGFLKPNERDDICRAVALGLNVDSGLHQHFTDDADLAALAAEHRVTLRDVRKPKPSAAHHFFSGKIEAVTSFRVAVLGTDSAVGKRTTAWLLVDAWRAAGLTCELIGTGQTAWLQGSRYGIIMDSLINDFVSGEIEHAVWSAWHETGADLLVIEGQGSLLNPAYPGGYEILAAARPEVIILQHAPARAVYDGFPDFPLDPLPRQIEVLQLIARKPVVAITINHEGLDLDAVPAVCERLEKQTGIPTVDVMLQGSGRLVDVLRTHLSR